MGASHHETPWDLIPQERFIPEQWCSVLYKYCLSYLVTECTLSGNGGVFALCHSGLEIAMCIIIVEYVCRSRV